MILNKDHRKILDHYQKSAERNSLSTERMRDANDDLHKVLMMDGFIEWKGYLYGTSQYSITDKGQMALRKSDEQR